MVLIVRKNPTVVRTRFNRRTAAVARKQNSVLVELYSFLNAAVSGLQIALQFCPLERARCILQDSFARRCGVYQVRYVRYEFEKTFSVCITAPDGKRLAAFLDDRTLEVLPC
ncbi:hypothetical protein FSY45_22565 [Comamonas sp. Z1]|uniref:hypothetical protein n=1 Tax=Comamonas TaxID=283 RepID=UPI000622B44B|nr:MULTISPECIES: hypothetical protein [Comamonas]KKI12334.1 hypothetical protein XA67_20125 [Comamonas thiooxydans]TYK72107.1 hypothetical protein FSY45_22565 [Comamonas sp. Z1]BCX53884.1 hypothetical protein CTYAZ2_34640 [Comamonas testosteroni]